MIAAVTARAVELAAELAPAGVEVLQLPDGRDAAAFVMPDWEDRETIEALPGLERLRLVQALSAGTECPRGPRSAMPAGPATPRWPSG